jgi:hypothetical protein
VREVGRFFDCDWDYNSQDSVIEGFPMSEVACLVSRVVVSRVVVSRLLSWVCVELGGQHEITCQITSYCL